MKTIASAESRDDITKSLSRVLIDLFESHSQYMALMDADERGDLSWDDMVTKLSPARGRYLKALHLAFETGYALTRRDTDG